MMVDFFEAFGKNTDMEKEIPAEILALLNKDLPKNFTYEKDNNGNYMIVPQLGDSNNDFRLITQLDLDEKLKKRVENLSPQKQIQYFYRMQQRIPVKNTRIGDENKQIPIEKTIGNPLSGKETMLKDAWLYPGKFSEPFPLVFESKENDRVSLLVQQQPYDSLAEVKFQNINFPSLSINFYYYSPLISDVSQENPVTSEESPFKMTFSIKPSKAETVKEVITALHMFKGLIDRTVKINGEIIDGETNELNVNIDQIKQAEKFWSIALQIEEKLKVSFRPNADFRTEDERLFTQLKLCLLDHKNIIWKHPFDHFHIDGYEPVNKSDQIESVIGVEGLCYRFWEGPIASSLLGAEFNLYSQTEIKDFVITNIEWSNDNREDAEVYIADQEGKTLILSRLYMTEEDYIERRNSNQQS